MADLRLYFDVRAPAVVDGALTFETGATPQQVMNPAIWAYEHHTEGFGQSDPGALTCLFEDLAMGRPTPAAFLISEIRDVDTLVAATLFLHRHLLCEPATVGFVAQIDLMHRRGFPFIGHLDADLGRFVRLLRGYFPDGQSVSEINARLPTAIQWIKDYLESGRLPALGAHFVVPTVLEDKRDGFVVAETLGSLPEGWFELYRQGFYRGVLFGPRQDGLLPVLVARKSAFVGLDLNRAALLLNEAEGQQGGRYKWLVSGDWLWSPPDGSVLLATQIIQAVRSVEVPLLPRH